jgi:hypothetical protein
VGDKKIPLYVCALKGGVWLTKNGNGHRGFWNPVKVFIRLVLGRWMKEDKVTGERYLVDSEDIKRDLDDIADEPQDQSTDDVN